MARTRVDNIMFRTSFGDWVDKKKRDSLKELNLVEKMLKKHGMKIENHLEDSDGEDPYVFCYNPSKEGSFDGIRIYKIGDKLAFRIQKESQTHPYGRAYALDIEEMYNDFLEDEETSEDKAGKKVIEAVVKEIRRFFEKSVEIERDDRKSGFGDPSGGSSPGGEMGNIAIRQQGSDYSSLIHSKT
jgi:hypothetical protein